MVYSGNWGYMHDVETVAAALSLGLPSGLEFRISGNGRGMAEIQRRLEGGRVKNVVLGPGLADEEWVDLMCSAQVALVTMRPGAEAVVIPSKTYSAFCAGQAVVAVCPRSSDLAHMISTHDAGWVVEPGDVAGLMAVLNLIGSGGDDLERKRRNAWTAGHERYDQTIVAAEWRSLLREVSAA
jgi:glycosyltransferase involved in cell wall biosynthesis